VTATEQQGNANVDLKSLRVPLIVDSALLLIIIFQSGVAWNQIGELRPLFQTQVSGADSIRLDISRVAYWAM
jgi:hypothetical protein